jgi:DNA invertase Pin-like site-specific DNA recombinase
MMKRAAVYVRVSSADQHPATQECDFRVLAEQRGLTVVEEYVDHGISGTCARRPGLDKLLADARSGHFEVVMVWAFDRLARSVPHLLRVLEELEQPR